MEVYLIRHGQSVNNALGSPAGRSHDPELTEIGFRQAEILAAHLADGECPESKWSGPRGGGYQLDRLYCSAMQRALQTAQPVGKMLGLQPEVWVDIHEQGGIYLDGDNSQRVGYPGLTRSQILEQFPDYVLPDEVTDSGWWNRGFETVAAATGRATAVAAALIERAKTSDERIGLISHGMFTNLLIKALLNQLPSPASYFYHYNTAISRIDIRDDGYIVLHYLNRINHLPVDLITY